jgi:lysozyme
MAVITNHAKDLAVKLIKQLEGFTPTPQWDVNGWAIGYGTHLQDPPKQITQQEAELLLRQQVDRTADQLAQAVSVPLADHQWAALISWAYNVGIGAALRSKLIAALNRGDTTEAACQFERWVYVKGKRLPGLEARRKRERAVFEGKEAIC